MNHSPVIGLSLQGASHPVTFHLDPSLLGTLFGEVREVYIAGTFTHWRQGALAMNRGEQGFSRTVHLTPGRYEYKFIINGFQWLPDPSNPQVSGDEVNSVLVVEEDPLPCCTWITPTPEAVISGLALKVRAQIVGEVPRALRLTAQGRSVIPQIQAGEILADVSDLAPGPCPIELKGHTAEGQEVSSQIQVYLLGDLGPTAIPGPTPIGYVGEALTLDGLGSLDPTQAGLRAHWTLGEVPATSQLTQRSLQGAGGFTCTFTPDQPGVYNFALKVWDRGGRSHVASLQALALRPTQLAGDHTFRLDPQALGKTPQEMAGVAVIGSFSAWSNRVPLHWTGQAYEVTLHLEGPEVEYKYVMGDTWWTDPANPQRSPEGNSLLVLDTAFRPEPRAQIRQGEAGIVLDGTLSQLNPGGGGVWIPSKPGPQLSSSGLRTIWTNPTPGHTLFHLVVEDERGQVEQPYLLRVHPDGSVSGGPFLGAPSWACDAIVYEVFVRRFSPEGDLYGLIKRLPALEELGINTLWLTPVTESPTLHGYHPTDLWTTARDLGGDQAFDAFMQAAKDHGMRVVFDLVVNHTSRSHPHFQAALNPASPRREYYRWVGPSQYHFAFDWADLPSINHENPQIRQEMLAVTRYWVERGVAGIRADYPWGPPLAFWQELRREIKGMDPEILLLAEALPADPSFHDHAFDSSYDTDLYWAIRDVLAGAPTQRIQGAVRSRQERFPANDLPFRYTENHDEHRLAGLHGLQASLAATILILTLPGIPMLYYGQEVGMTQQRGSMNWNPHGAQDQLREAMGAWVWLRRNQKALCRGTLRWGQAQAGLLTFFREIDGEEVAVQINLGPTSVQPQSLTGEWGLLLGEGSSGSPLGAYSARCYLKR